MMHRRYDRISSLFLGLTALLVCSMTNLYAQMDFIPLGGTLPPTVVKAAKPYLVTAYLEVPYGQQTIIEEGVVFLFKNFTGINVQGTIRVEGTPDEPVVFTSENDSLYNTSAAIEPAAFDWDGISIGPGDNDNVFAYCLVQYSLYGIKSATERIVLTACSFKENGNSDVVIGGEKVPVVSSPFTRRGAKVKSDERNGRTGAASFNTTMRDSDRQTGAAELSFHLDDNAQSAPQTEKIVPVQKVKKRSAGKVVLRLLSIAAVAGGGILGVKEHVGYGEAREEFAIIDDFQTSKTNFTSDDWEQAKSHVHGHLYKTIAFYGCALVGATVFTITFTF